MTDVVPGGTPGRSVPDPAPGRSAPAVAPGPTARWASPADVRARRARLGRLGDEIARLSAHLQAATGRQLDLIRAFDEERGWHEEGFASCARWLAWRTGITPGAAREKVRVAGALGRLPALRAALHAGELSYSVARALTRVATPDNEAELLEVARHSTAAQMERLVAAWRAAEEAEEAERERERERHARRELWVLPASDGSWTIHGRLDPEAGAVLRRALEAAGEALYGRAPAGPDTPPPEARRADALGLLAEAALGRGLGAPAEEAGTAEETGAREADPGEPGPQHAGPGAPGADPDAADPETAASTPGPRPVVGRAERFQVVLHVSAETLAARSGAGRAYHTPEPPRLEPGARVSAETARRIACDAGLVPLTRDRRGDVLDVGRRTRTVPPTLRRALDHRDRRCRFPGCDARHCDAHHIRHWAHGGPTRLDNLVLLCRRHHRLVHEHGWRVTRTPDGRAGAARAGGDARAGGELRFYRPDGRLLPHRPPAPAVPDRPAAALERRHRALGLGIDAWTPTPAWDGSPMDVDWALFTLRRPARLDAARDVSAETPLHPRDGESGPHVSAETSDPGDVPMNP